MNTIRVTTSFLAGIAVGAILGILYAPDKGCNTRKKITKKSADVIDVIKNGLADLSNVIKDKYENIKEDTMTLMEKTKDVAKTGV